MKVAVIGAGVSGLTAANRIRKAGHEPIVIEAQDQAGGRCKVLKRDGFLIDTGPELVASSYRHWMGLAEDVGLTAEIITTPTTIGIIKNGKVVELDFGKPLAAATTPLLSLGAKVKMVAGAMGLGSKIRAVPSVLLDAGPLDEEGRTAMDVSLEAFGKEVTETFLDPMIRPVGGTRMDLLSTALVPYLLSEWTQMMALKGGLQRLLLTAAAGLDVRYNANVERVMSNVDGVSLEVRNKDGTVDTVTADKCLITAQIDDAGRIYPAFAALKQKFCPDIGFLRMMDLKLAYARRPASKAGLIMCPFKETKDINLIALSHNKAPDRTPPGCGLFSIFTEHLEFDRFNAMSDAEILQVVQPQVEALFPEIKGHLLFTHVGRYSRVSMLPHPGYFRQARQLWDAVGQEPRVHLGGDIFNAGAGMEASAMTGDLAADRLLQS